MTVIELLNAELVRPLLTRWKQEANGDGMGIILDVDYTYRDVARTIAHPASIVFGLVKDDIVVGMIGVRLSASPTGPQTVANEHYFYVAKEHRGVGSVRLLKAAKGWARGMGCSHILFSASHLASDKHDMVCKLYEKFGCRPFETTYISEVK